MLRNDSIERITEGGRYTAESTVAINPDGCKGCHLCCETVEDTIVLDPYDLWCLETGLGKTFEELMQREISLGIYDGVILPHLNLVEAEGKRPGRAAGEPQKHCVFLSESGESAGRCRIHDFRPGFCRLYPMGRLYEAEGFSYVILKDQCPYPDKKECTVKEWLGISDLERYEVFVLSWHSLVAGIRDGFVRENEEDRRKISLYLLKVFYLTPWEKTGFQTDSAAGFYEEFEKRIETVKKILFAE